MKNYSITLSIKELQLLRNVIEHNLQSHSRNIVLNIKENLLIEDEDSLIYLRNAVGDYLMYVGFDIDDKPTPEGLELEKFIDKLFDSLKPIGVINKLLNRFNRTINHFERKEKFALLVNEFCVNEFDNNGILRRLAISSKAGVIVNQEKKVIVTVYNN